MSLAHFLLYFLLYGIIKFEQQVLLVFLSVTFDRRVQCSRVGLEVNKYNTPARGIRASQGTFSSCFIDSTIPLLAKSEISSL